jgi:phosphoesterase RecJ-like protein
LQSIAGVEAMVIIKQETPSECTVGLRSRDTIDVAKIAGVFGGGGHKNASGLLVTGNIEKVKFDLLQEFEKYLEYSV